MIRTFLLAFIPLFVAIDVFGVMPFFLSLTEGMAISTRRKLAAEATLTAFGVSLLFVAAGKLIFSFLGITENDFKVGGGAVLLVLAVKDLLFSKQEQRDPESSLGVVPIGIPLIMGPAALTTILILVDSRGYVWTLASLFVNMLIVWSIFSRVHYITKFIGRAGSKAVAKVFALFLAGIAIMMIRSGISAMIHHP